MADAEILALGLDASGAAKGAADFERAATGVATSATKAARGVDQLDTAMKEGRAAVQQMTAAQQQMQQRIEALRQSIERLNAGDAQAVRQIKERIQTEMQLAQTIQATNSQQQQLLALQGALKAQLDSTARSNVAAGIAAGGHGLQLGRLRMELGTLVGRLTGTNTALDRMGGAIAAIGLGDPIVIGALAGIAAIGLAWEKLTEQSRKAREEHEKQIEVLKRLKEQEKNTLPNAVDAGRQDMARVQAQMDALRAERERLVAGRQSGASGGLFVVAGIDARLKDLQKQYDDAADLVARGERKLIEETSKGADQQTAAMVAHIAQLVASTFARASDIQNAQTLIKGFTDTLTRLPSSDLEGRTTLIGYIDQLDGAIRQFQGRALEPINETLDQFAKLMARAREESKKADEAFKNLGVENTGSYRQRALDATTEIIQRMQDRGVSPPKVESFEESWKRILHNANETTRAIDEQARAIERSVDEATRLAELFGLVDKNVAQIVRGLGQAYAGIGPLADAMNRRDAGTGSTADVFLAAVPVVGGFLSAANGLMKASDAQHEAAVRLMEAAEQFKNDTASFKEAAYGTGTSREIESLRQTYQKLIDALNALHPVTTYGNGQYSMEDYAGYQRDRGELDRAYQAQVQRITEDFWRDIARQENELLGPAGAYANSMEEIQRQYEENRKTVELLGGSQEDLQRIEALRVKSIEQLIVAESHATDVSQSLLQRFASLTGATLNTGDPFAELRTAIQRAIDNGLNELADALKTELKLDEQFNAYLDGIQAQKDAAQRAQDDAQMQQQVLQELLSVAQEQERSLETSVNTLKQNLETIRRLSDSLKLNKQLTTLGPEAQYEEAKRQYDAIAALAAGGDQSAIASLPETAQAFLEASRFMFASSEQYVQDYNRVQTFLASLNTQYTEQLSTQEKLLEEAQKHTALLQAQVQTSRSQLVEQLVSRVSASPDASTQASVRDMLHQLGYELYTNLISDGNGLYHTSGFYAKQGYTNANDPTTYIAGGGDAYGPGTGTGTGTGTGSTAAGSAYDSAAQYQSYVNRHGDDPMTYYEWMQNGQPAYDRGGFFGGGMRLVGESGMELEVTGPSRIFNAGETSNIIAQAMGSGAEMLVEIRGMRADLRSGRALDADGYSAIVRKLDSVANRLERVEDELRLERSTVPG